MASHALLAGGGVWIVDPTEGDGIEERIRALGEPAGVLQLLDRHNRACAAFAERLGVPHHRVPFEAVGPFETRADRRRKRWQEVALWWPERRVLVTRGRARDGAALLRPRRRAARRPPAPARCRRRGSSRALDPEHVLCGHGAGVHERATEALRDALANSRRRLPRLALELPAALLGR